MFLKAKFELGPDAIVESASDPETGTYALRLKLDPGVLVFTASRGEDGSKELAAFLSRLSSEAGLLAAVLDLTAPRQGLLAHWFSESGAGGYGTAPEVTR